MKVIGAGLSRTATMSTNLALEKLGHPSPPYDRDTKGAWPHRGPVWARVLHNCHGLKSDFSRL